MEQFRLDPTLYTGAPEVCNETKGRCYAALEALHIPFTRAEHTPADTIALCHQVETLLGAQICKNLFLCNRQKTKYYLLLLKGDQVFHTKDLSAQLGCARLSFGDSAAMERYLGTRPGSASVLGLLWDKENAVQLVIDKKIREQTYIGCHPCDNTATLKLAMSDLLDKYLPFVAHEPIFVDLPEEDA